MWLPRSHTQETIPAPVSPADKFQSPLWRPQPSVRQTERLSSSPVTQHKQANQSKHSSLPAQMHSASPSVVTQQAFNKHCWIINNEDGRNHALRKGARKALITRIFPAPMQSSHMGYPFLSSKDRSARVHTVLMSFSNHWRKCRKKFV